MKKYLSPLFTAFVLFGMVYLLNNGFRVNEKLRIPGIMKILNPFDGFWQNRGLEYGPDEETITIEGRDGTTNIYFDERMVPHIFAESLNDALFAQGYVYAQHRLWQMDFIKRLAAGRLSEVLGKATKDRDLRMRKYGLAYAADNAVKSWDNSSPTGKLAQSYIDGVNHYMKNMEKKDLPMEFKLANYRPEPWDQKSSALVSKYMAFTLSSSHRDLGASNARMVLGDSLFHDIYLESDRKQIPVIREDLSVPSGKTREKPEDVEYKDGFLKGLHFKQPIKGLGSNNWAVSGSKTKSGNAILANDPHLRLTLPSIWYEIHIVTPEINAYGVTIPGLPGIIIGFNDHIAYGSTNVGHDVLDYYTIDWVDKEKGTYRLDGQVKQAKKVEQSIKVKNGIDYNYDMWITEFGPIMYESDNDETPDLAVQWMAHEEPSPDELTIFLKAMQCQDYDCYKEATKAFFNPAQNFVYADTEGNIGLRVNGNLPVKYEGEGQFVKKGNKLENKWTEIIPRDANPQSYNPSLGFVSSANQVSVGEDYGNYFNGGFEDYRGRRLNELLENTNDIDFEKTRAMQLDVLSVKAREFVPILLQNWKKQSQNEAASGLIKSLEDWDYNYSKEARAAHYFELITDELEDLVWDELDIEDLSVSTPDFWQLYQLALKDQSHVIFDRKETPEKEDFSSLVQLALTNCADKISGTDADEWAKRKQLNVAHYLNIPGYSSFNIPIEGNGDVLNANRTYTGPSWRMIVEMSKPVKAWGVLPGGQSGNPLSPYYDDSLDDWIEGNYHEILFTKDEEAYHSKAKKTQIIK